MAFGCARKSSSIITSADKKALAAKALDPVIKKKSPNQKKAIRISDTMGAVLKFLPARFITTESAPHILFSPEND